MTALLLADSDQLRLTGLIDSLQSIRPDWNISGCHSGSEVLQSLQDQRIDCFISDSVLADMDPTQLLTQVRKQHPDIIRFVLSADHSHELVMRCTQASHRFIDRRIDGNSLATAIEDSISLTQTLDSPILRACVNDTTRLPALPVIYQKMMEILLSPDGSLTDISKLVETDIGLSATILNIVNSAFYGFAQRVDSISQCVALLGPHLVKNMSLTASVFSQFEGSEMNLEKLRQLNDQANQTGAMATHFAKLAKAPKIVTDQVQIAGMLGNTGVLIYTRDASDDARDALPIEHEQLSALLLRIWHMPDTIVEAVALQNKGPLLPHNTNQALHILHSLRYFETHFTDAKDEQQIDQCSSYLKNWIDEKAIEQWMDTYANLCLHTDLPESTTTKAA